jgi:2-polyprenyl-3-methyl-5-hydroxy-6-metoxy-1,4-benzoquinol methylase
VDIGCCTGLNTVLLKKYARQTIGWDMSPQAIELAKRKHPELEVRQVVFPEAIGTGNSGAYSIVTLFDVLEHIKDDRAAIKAVEDLLEPGGAAFITVPAFRWLWTEHDEILHHYRRYTLGSLRDLISENTKLSLVKINYFNFFMFLPIVLIRFAKRIFNIKTGAPDDSTPVPRPLNTLFFMIFGLERYLLRWLRLPFGISILAVVRKQPDESSRSQRAQLI